ncbi:hypothetical protein B0T21DRAFT_374498 [Apiosordaria backusii]|uniref:Uncharacterized protein n=1 Tax=Apiosordaria backusii TaxID=314023 RepID=A0AA40DWI1_9PEZI|nr:hypothetical protein B0T21DRAFT_374498 [Apiosordaria backusii]
MQCNAKGSDAIDLPASRYSQRLRVRARKKIGVERVGLKRGCHSIVASPRSPNLATPASNSALGTPLYREFRLLSSPPAHFPDH